MSEIHVQFESLETGASGIKSNYAKLQATLEQLNSDLQPMLSSWSGAAQEAYNNCKREWDNAADQLAVVLSNIGQAVTQAHENYTGAEQAALNNWS
ncbi:WXG100 family type VII secretion target [Jatrophihabitans endophyticus]|uniref:WXG100 family type VII secretion target n=1 Tax=Jatrophihabitans endophyticus TaxID=1206085 RepID=UPI001A105D58|nr:WXG100 family type VII secretion target [Jatrophihabitans endophyticus]MBE7186694.1 WXG100 family type VII secretion target [Jatrophihabitans endophyticus]